MIARIRPDGSNNWEIVVDREVVGTWYCQETAQRLANLINDAAARAYLPATSAIVEDHAAINAPFGNVVQLRRG